MSNFQKIILIGIHNYNNNLLSCCVLHYFLKNSKVKDNYQLIFNQIYNKKFKIQVNYQNKFNHYFNRNHLIYFLLYYFQDFKLQFPLINQTLCYLILYLILQNYFFKERGLRNFSFYFFSFSFIIFFSHFFPFLHLELNLQQFFHCTWYLFLKIFFC